MATKKKTKSAPKHINIYYSEGAGHETFHVQGAWAVLTTQLEIQVAFYNEIQPMPRMVRHELAPQGVLGKIVETDGDQGVLREVATTLVFDPGVAAQLMQLLQALIDRARPQIEAQVAQSKKALDEAQLQIETKSLAK